MQWKATCFHFQRCQLSLAGVDKVNGIHFSSSSQEKRILLFRCFVYSISLCQCKVLNAITGKPEILRFIFMTPLFPQRLCSSNCYCTFSLPREPGCKNKHTKAHIQFQVKLIGTDNLHFKSSNLTWCNNIQHSKTILTFSLSLHKALGHIISRA